MVSNEDVVSMNRMAVIDNPYQGDAKRVLCVCSAGVLRSPTLAAYLNKTYGFNTRAVGVDSSYALIPISRALVMWADEIWCVSEEVHTKVINYIANDLKRNYTKDMKVLELPDRFPYNDPELLKEIEHQISTFKLV